MERRVEDIRDDIKAIEEEIAIQSKNPKVAEYLRRRNVVDELSLRMDKLSTKNEKESLEQYNIYSTQLKEGIKELDDYVEQEADNLEVRNCVRLVNLKDKFSKELQTARGDKYIKQVVSCNHIFWTGHNKNGRIETTCLKCGFCSSPKFFLRSPERLKNMLSPIGIRLFFHGEMYKYTFVSNEFKSLQEAKEAWSILSENKNAGILDPCEEVEKMLQIRDSRMRRH